MSAVVDPGFPRGGGVNSPGRGGGGVSVCRQHNILPNFPKNDMKLKEFGPEGAHPSRPLRSANGQYNLWYVISFINL